jgi:mRNA interferase MazF
VIVPITNWKDRYSIALWMVKLEPTVENSLDKTSVADCFQVRSVSRKRFIKKIGTVSGIKLIEITEALAIVLGIDY